MANIDKHSETWQAVTEWAQKQRADAIDMLIADRDAEQQRGKIDLLDNLLRQTQTESNAPIVSDTYL